MVQVRQVGEVQEGVRFGEELQNFFSSLKLTILKIKNQDMKSSAYLAKKVVVKEIFYSLLQGFPLKKLIVAVLSPFSASDVFNQQ